MQLEVGAVIEGKITGITKFGAFVVLEEGKSGLVHISEVANAFVNDVHDFVQEGQSVKVKVIGIGQDGKINLSIKKAEEQQDNRSQAQGQGSPLVRQPYVQQPRQQGYASRQMASAEGRQGGDVNFEDKLKQFMVESDSKNADNKRHTDRRNGARRKK